MIKKNESAFFTMLSSLREIVNTMDGEIEVKQYNKEGDRLIHKKFKGREYLYQLYEYFKKNHTYDELPEELMFNPETNKLHEYKEEQSEEIDDFGAVIRIPIMDWAIDIEGTKSEVINAFNNVVSPHKHNLDHYFRFIQSLVEFIDDIEYEPYKERYTTILKAQLSTYEMGLIFYHSLNNFGEHSYPYNFLENLDYESFTEDWHHFFYMFTNFKYLSQEELKQRKAYEKYLNQQFIKKRREKRKKVAKEK